MSGLRKQPEVWLMAVLCLLFIGVWPVSSSLAQTTAPTPTLAIISVVVRGAGSSLWNADDGRLIMTLAPGEGLQASARSADGKWLLVQTAPGRSPAGLGWVAMNEALVFNSEALPVEEVTISPAEPTPVPTPTATPAAAPAQNAQSAAPVAVTSAITTDNSTGTTSVVSASGVDVKTKVNLNVRSGPGTNYPIIGGTTTGQTLNAIGQNNGGTWLQIQQAANQGNGWVSAAYVTTSEGISSLPVVAAPPLSTPAGQTTTAAAAPPQPAGGGLRGKLVLQSTFGGAIYLYDLTSGVLRQLTTGFDPTLSPDGSQVAFTRVGGEHGLYVINSDGTGERRVFAEREGFWSPKWSPDGRYILFVRSDSGWKCKDYTERFGFYDCHSDEPGDGDLPYIWEIRPHLARVDLDGKNYLDLATLHSASSPDWNSAGIVYASEAGIQVASDDGKDTNHKVYFDNLQQYYQDPDWQPGGGRIVLQQQRPGHWDIYAVNPDGSGFTALTRPATALVDTMPSNVSPAWSPDGQHIVFLSNRTPSNEAGPWSVWVMNADGSNQHPLPIDLPFEYNYVEEQMIDWSP